ncbi:MAG: AMP-binding protein [Xanthobacteraceae bacterium]
MALRAPREASFDALERRSMDERDAALAAALSGLIARARDASTYYGKLFAAIDPADITDPAALAELPVTRKSDLKTIQENHPPFGGLDTAPQRFARIFSSPGPVYEPEAMRPDYWRYGRALWATGIRPGDLVHNCFAYHFTPAGAMMETGAHAIGATVFPGGTGQTDQQAQAAAVLRPIAYTGTPDFLRTIIEHGDSQGLDLTCFRLAHVTAGAFLPDARAFYQSRSIDVLQSYGTAEIGLIAYESPAREGLIIDEGVIVEIVEPGTGTPVADGEPGELLVTVLNPEYPLIRFATGDLSAMLAGQSPCGRTNRRIKGWLGRADQSTKIKGMFVHPHQVADIMRRHPDIGHARLVVTREHGADVMILRVETQQMGADFARAVEESVHTVTRLRGRVEAAPSGSLPRDGRAIEDARDYGG